MSTLVAVAACAVAAAVLAVLVPVLIRSLPEPEPPALPADPAEDSTLQAQLRREGPKEEYAVLASRRWLLPLAVAVAAVAAGALAWRFGAVWELVALVPLVVVGVALAVIDVRTRLLPTRIVLPATAFAVATGVVGALALDQRGDLVRALVAMLVARGIFWLLWFVARAGLGFGDVRLSALLGFVLGWFGVAEVVVGLYAGYLVFGALVVVLMVVTRDRSLLKRHLPFGPFLLVGAWLGLLAGPAVARALGY